MSKKTIIFIFIITSLCFSNIAMSKEINAGYFDGSEYKEEKIDIGDEFSYALSIKPETFDVYHQRILEHGGYQVGGGYALEFNQANQYNLAFLIYNNTDSVGIKSKVKIPIDKVTDVLITYDGAKAKLYIDEKLQGEINATMTVPNSNLFIGRASRGEQEYFTGEIKNLNYYDHVINLNEYKENKQSESNALDDIISFLFSSEENFFIGIGQLILIILVITAFAGFMYKFAHTLFKPGKINNKLKSRYDWYKDKISNVLHGLRKK